MDLQKLTDFGLSGYEARCYLFLAGEGVSTPSEVSLGSGVPYGRIYDVLKGLEKKGFAKKVEDKPVKYLAVSPSIVLKKVLAGRLEKIEELSKEVERLVKEIDTSKKREHEPRERIRIIRGRQDLLRFMIHVHKRAKNEWRSLSYSLFLDTEYLNQYRDDVERGVEVRNLIFNPEKKKEAAKIWKEVGMKIRRIKGLTDPPARFSVRDKEEVVFRFGREPGEYYSIWINEPALAHMMADYFDMLWKEGKEINWDRIESRASKK